MKHLPTGEVRVVILIPETDKSEGVKLADAFSCALQVEVTKKSYGR